MTEVSMIFITPLGSNIGEGEGAINSNKLLNLTGCTVKYGPVKWPIITTYWLWVSVNHLETCDVKFTKFYSSVTVSDLYALPEKRMVLHNLDSTQANFCKGIAYRKIFSIVTAESLAVKLENSSHFKTKIPILHLYLELS